MNLEQEVNKEQLQTDDKLFWETGQALGFPIRFSAVLAHLRQDMRDDWYFDCLQYNDLFKSERHVKDTIIKLLAEWNGRYEGNKSFVRDIPKKGYGERYGLETDFFDRFIYQAICSFLIPYYDPILGHRVLSYRYEPWRKKEKYLFKNKIEQWFIFEGVTLTFKRSNKFLLVTDLSNFFENVSRNQIINALEGSLSTINAPGPVKLQIRNAISTLDKLLSQWTFSGDHGLPQNRDASSFFSNVLLSEVDRCMAKKNHDYYRYVDDIRIIADTEADARRALQDLIRELRKVGMNINAAKTDILGPDTCADKISMYFPSIDSRTTSINNMWQSRSRRIVTRSIEYIVKMLIECIDNNDTQSRQFRFAVNRLSKVVESGVLLVDDSLRRSLLDILLSSLSGHAVSTDQYCRLISVLDTSGVCNPSLAEFLLHERGAIHDWQNYNIWILLATRRYKTPELLDLAANKLNESMTSGEAAAIFIWLRCVGEPQLIQKAVEGFSHDWPSQNTRYLLIATDVLPASSTRSLHGRIATKLMGTLSRSKGFENSEGLPFSDREPVDVFDLVEEISGYD